MQDCVFHLKHLQAILIEFDADRAQKKATLIQLFGERRKRLVKAKME